jgi:hypothetical protein
MPLEVKQFNCPQCGSALDLKNLQSKSVICPSCSSQIDLTGPQYQVVGRVGSRPTPRMTQFQPGMQGTLNGEAHEVIGRVLYRSDEGDVWDEWLLLSASGQYRWISDSEEEGMALWEPFVPTNPIDPNTIREGQSINLRGAPARVRDRGSARIDYLEGELTWKARLGDTMEYAEAEGPDGRYSIEWTPEEVEFYWGQRLNRREIEPAFGITGSQLTAAGAGGGRKKGGCLSTAIVAAIVIVMICLCVAIASAMPSSESGGSITFGGSSIRSGSPGRSFSGGGGGGGGK